MKDQLPDKMNQILVDSYAIYLKTQNFHWNVISKHAFASLHNLFQNQYEELAEAIDDIAEKIRQLGVKTPAGLSVFSKMTNIKDGDENATADEMIQDLIADQVFLIKMINDGIKIAYDFGDEGAADLLIERLRAHDKNKWMLESSL